MDYKLAKKLKDLGFKQGWNLICEHDYQPTDGIHSLRSDWKKDDTGMYCGGDSAHIPTLAELIEACGKKIIGIDRTDEGWKAAGVDFERNEVIVFTANNLEDAVSELWLRLNKK